MDNFYKNIPNQLTWLRVALIFFLLISYLSDYHHLMAPIFIIATLSDWLDGFLARRWNAQTPFGAFLDPVADKLIVSCALIILVHTTASKTLLVCVTLIILREVAMSSLRHWASAFKETSDIPVSFLGKVKTASQLVGITLLLCKEFNVYVEALKTSGTFTLAFSALAGWLSFFYYFQIVSSLPDRDIH